MSLARLDSRIATVMRDRHLDPVEATGVVSEALPNVSNVEAKSIGALFVRVTSPARPPRGSAFSLPNTVDPGAIDVLESFFAKKGLPFGTNKERMSVAIGDVLRSAVLEKAARKPHIDKYISLVVDGQNVFVDVAKKRFFVQMGDGYSAALALPKITAPAPVAPRELSDARKAQILARVERLESNGLVNWSSGMPTFARGSEIYHADLKGSAGGVGGVAYDAMILLGHPLAGPLMNPNDVTSMWIVKREGRGPTRFAQLDFPRGAGAP